MKNKENIVKIKSETQLTAKALKVMAKQGIGHGRLYEVALSLQKKSKKSKK